MRFDRLKMLLVVGVLFVWSISAAANVVPGNNIEIKTNRALIDVDDHNLKGTGKQNESDNVVEENAKTHFDQRAVVSDDEERAVTSALTKLQGGVQKTRDLTKLRNSFKKKPPIITIRSADINKMKITLVKNPSLEKSLDKIPLKAVQENVKRMSGFEKFIMDVSLIKLLFVLTIVGVLSTGVIMITSLAMSRAARMDS